MYILIVVLGIILFFIGAFLGLYFIFSQKEIYFKKHLQIGDECLIYIDEFESLKCEIVSMSDEGISVKDSDGKIYKVNKDEVVSP